MYMPALGAFHTRARHWGPHTSSTGVSHYRGGQTAAGRRSEEDKGSQGNARRRRVGVLTDLEAKSTVDGDVRFFKMAPPENYFYKWTPGKTISET